MSPRTIADLVHRDAPVIAADATIQAALPVLLFSRLPALPVVDDNQRFKGIFGEREFITALFPGYVGSLKHAGFVPKSIDAALEKRQSCRTEPVSKHMNTEHIDVGPDFSDVGLAEIFIHHRVLIVPVVEDKRVVGVITRSDFFAAVAQRFLGDPP
jgi:CBS-domain-containing membrane protein